MRWSIVICFLMAGCHDMKPDSGDYEAYRRAADYSGTIRLYEEEENAEQNNSSSQLKRYGIECGSIRYEISGLQTGIQLLFFDNYGLKEAKYTWAEVLVPGMEQRINKLEIIQDGFYYVIDYGKKSGVRMKQVLNPDVFEPQAMLSLGAEMIGVERFMDRDCEVWETKELANKIWAWCSIPLKAVTEMQGLKIEFVASEVQWGMSTPDEKFAIPDGIEILSVDSVLDNMPEIPLMDSMEHSSQFI